MSKSVQKCDCFFDRFSLSFLSHFGSQSEWFLETFWHIFVAKCEMCENVDFSTALKREAYFRGSKVTKNGEKTIPVAFWNRSWFEASFGEHFDRFWEPFCLILGEKNDVKNDD